MKKVFIRDSYYNITNELYNMLMEDNSDSSISQENNINNKIQNLYTSINDELEKPNMSKWKKDGYKETLMQIDNLAFTLEDKLKNLEQLYSEIKNGNNQTSGSTDNQAKIDETKYQNLIKVYTNITNELSGKNLKNPNEYNLTKIINGESSTNNEDKKGTLYKQKKLFNELKDYIKNSMRYLGYTTLLTDYVISTGKTQYSVAYDRIKKNDTTFLNNISDRFISQEVDNYIKLKQENNSDINNACKGIKSNASDNSNIIIGSISVKFFMGWFYKFLELTTNRNKPQKISKYDPSKSEDEQILYMLDKITYDACNNLFYIGSTNEGTLFTKEILNKRNDKTLKDEAENVFYMNVICFREEVFNDMVDFLRANGELSSSNGESKLIFKKVWVKRVKNAKVETFQVYLDLNTAKQSFNKTSTEMVCNLDVIYAFGKVKPFIKNLKDTVNGLNSWTKHTSM